MHLPGGSILNLSSVNNVERQGEGETGGEEETWVFVIFRGGGGGCYIRLVVSAQPSTCFIVTE